MSDEQEYKISQCDQDRRGAFGREGVPELSILFLGSLKSILYIDIPQLLRTIVQFTNVLRYHV